MERRQVEDELLLIRRMLVPYLLELAKIRNGINTTIEEQRQAAFYFDELLQMTYALVKVECYLLGGD